MVNRLPPKSICKLFCIGLYLEIFSLDCYNFDNYNKLKKKQKKDYFNG